MVQCKIRLGFMEIIIFLDEKRRTIVSVVIMIVKELFLNLILTAARLRVEEYLGQSPFERRSYERGYCRDNAHSILQGSPFEGNETFHPIDIS